MAEIHEISEGLRNGDNPKNAKIYLAREIVKLYHGGKDSDSADKEFENVFKKGNKPESIERKKVKSKSNKVDDLLVELELASSKSEAKRLVEQGGVRIDDSVVKDWNKKIATKKGMVVQVGKRKFVEIV